MMHRFLIVCVVSPFLLGGALAQTRSSQPDSEALVNVQYLLNDVNHRIRTVDEPAMRAFLRLQVAQFLLREGSTAMPDAAETAEQAILEGIADLNENESRLPSSMARYYRRELLALLKLRSPRLYDQIVRDPKQEKDSNRQTQFDVAYSMLDRKDGVGPAVSLITSLLKSGQTSNSDLSFFLDRLRETNADMLSQVLGAMLQLEEAQPGSIDFYNLSLMSEFYIQPGPGPSLTARYLTVALRDLENQIGATAQGTVVYNYQFLQRLLPSIQGYTPDLAPQAMVDLNRLSAALNSQSLERVRIQQRVAASDDPLEQLRIEADQTTDSSLKRDLLVQAGQMAADKGKIRLAADLMDEACGNDHNLDWHDQFIGDLVSRALKTRDADLAMYIARKVREPLKQARAEQQVGLFYLEDKNNALAVEAANDAAKLVLSAQPDMEKVKGLLRLSAVFSKVDDARVFEMASEAVKVMNGCSDHPEKSDENAKSDKAESAAREKYLWDINQVSWFVMPAFRLLAQRDEIAASSLASSIRRPDLKAVAMLGMAEGLFAEAQMVRSKAGSAAESRKK